MAAEYNAGLDGVAAHLDAGLDDPGPAPLLEEEAAFPARPWDAVRLDVAAYHWRSDGWDASDGARPAGMADASRVHLDRPVHLDAGAGKSADLESDVPVRDGLDPASCPDWALADAAAPAAALYTPDADPSAA